MNVTPKPAIDCGFQKQVERIQKVLEESTEISFTFWQHSSGSNQATSASSDTSSANGDAMKLRLGECGTALETHQNPFCLEWSNTDSLLVVPLRNGRVLLGYLVGAVPKTTQRLCRSLAEQIVRVHFQEHELVESKVRVEECIQQITRNFEELNWLRNLAEHFEICEVGSNVARVANSTLPSLRMLVGSEAIFLFDCPNRGESDQEAIIGDLIHLEGETSVSEHEARQAIHGLKGLSSHRAVIRNSTRPGEPLEGKGRIHSMILARVTSQRNQIGWLLVVNKVLAPDQDRLLLLNKNRSELEFGTFEAGLISAISVMLGSHGRNVDLFRERDALLSGVIRALINSIDAKDRYTCGHSDRVAQMSTRIASELGLSAKDCEQIHMSGLLHDIGKIGVPDYVLSKPDRLTESEFALVKLHPTIGFEILKDLKPISYVLPGVLHHHEAFDGSGYPHGLSEENIPLFGRIIAVADSFDAMTSDRPYRSGMPRAEAERILLLGSGTQWDPNIIRAFLRIVSGMEDIYGSSSQAPPTSQFINAPISLPIEAPPLPTWQQKF